MGRHKERDKELKEATHKLTKMEKTEKKMLWHKFLARLRKLALCDNQDMFIMLIESNKDSWMDRYIN